MSGYSSVSAPPTTSLSESPYLGPGETCSTLAVAAPGATQGCHVWRSCRSCLQKVGCMVNPMNRCESQTNPAGGYNPNMDYRKAIARNLTVSNTSSGQDDQSFQYWQFPAIETKYCAVDDAVCNQCKRVSFYRRTDQIDSRFCVGAGGCVCIFSCEFPSVSALLADCGPYTAPTSSYAPSPTTIAVGDKSASMGTLIEALPLMTVLGMGAFLVYFARREHAKSRRAEELRVQRARATRTQGLAPRMAAVGVPSLGLSGWNQHREHLVAVENLRLAGTGDVEATEYEQISSPMNSNDLVVASTASPAQRPQQTEL